jgi:hypothetical protein
MDLYEYIKESYPEFSEEIFYFLNNEDCIVFGGFVKSILNNQEWNKELDVLCYDFDKTYKEFATIFPPKSIEDIQVHSIFNYADYKIDICKIFKTNDFTFNCLGLIGENITVIPNVFSNNIQHLLSSFDRKEGLGSKMCPNFNKRKLKYKNWKIITYF